jgi:Family of unknown function (DUF6062)
MPKLEISRVHDAYEQGGTCPLCTLMDGAERTCLASFQHSRVMEPNVRVKTNALGFCPDHLGKLFKGENKLGLGLVMLTHLQEKSAEVCSALDGSIEAAEGGGRDRMRRIRQIIDSLEALRDSCFICGLLAQDLARYSWTILYLWRKDPQFPPLFRASRGFCLSHFCTVLATACDVLRGDRLALWLHDAVPVMKRALAGLEDDLLAFTQLHKAENRSLGTDEVRSALARTLQLLAGRVQRQS